MAWTINISATAVKQLKKLDKTAQKRIVSFLHTKIEVTHNPRQQGKALKGDKGGLWRYRLGDYRIICQIQDEIITLLVLEVGHYKEVYRK